MISYLTRIIIIVGILFNFTVNAQNTISIEGRFVNSQNNTGIPGLSIQLVHPEHGRSVSAITDNNGQFILYDVPMDRNYFIEAYWGDELHYRMPVDISRSQNLGTIEL